jgi:hypothetical protein
MCYIYIYTHTYTSCPAGSPRRLIWRHATQHQLAAGTEWQNVTSPANQSANASLSFSFRIRCTGDNYGDGCDTSCKERDDSFGHHTCNKTDGSRICHPGWTGQYCDKRTSTSKFVLFRNRCSGRSKFHRSFTIAFVFGEFCVNR